MTHHTNVTRADLTKILEPGDCLLVQYAHPGIVGRSIEFFEHDKVSHVLCYVGKDGPLDIVEADVGGIMRTSLDSYLRGNCKRLTIKRARGMRPGLAGPVTAYWLQQVSRPYDWRRIVGAVLAFLLRDVCLRVSPAAARWCLRHVRNRFASRSLDTCDVLWVRGVRKELHGFMAHEALTGNFSPGLILESGESEVVRVLENPKLVKEARE